MVERGETVDEAMERLAATLDLTVDAPLPARSNQSWRVRQGGEVLVLRRYLDQLDLGHELLGRSIEWQMAACSLAVDAGWPAPSPVGVPIHHAGAWWTLEGFLPGEHLRVTPGARAKVITDWHNTGFAVDQFGPRPGALDRLAILEEPDASAVLERCLDETDRRWLLRRLDQAVALAEGIDWTASRRVLVHGDLLEHNLLWSGTRLTGLIDFEFARVDRRVTEAILTWRCRYDDVLLAVHRLDPLNDQEWRMLLVDWWTLSLTLAATHLRRGRQPDRWELDALRRSTPLSAQLEQGIVPVSL